MIIILLVFRLAIDLVIIDIIVVVVILIVVVGSEILSKVSEPLLVLLQSELKTSSFEGCVAVLFHGARNLDKV